MHTELHIAHAYSPKFRTFIVAAYVLESGHPGLPAGQTFKVLGNYAIDESRAIAEREAVDRIFRDNVRHDPSMPVVRHGRMAETLVTSFYF